VQLRVKLSWTSLYILETVCFTLVISDHALTFFAEDLGVRGSTL